MSQTAPGQYTAVAIVLHWAIAAAIVGNLLLGWWMQNAIDIAETQARAIAAFQLHKSLGFTILALSLARLGWRLAHRPPDLPAAMPGWEKLAARATHWAFYILMIGIPLSGWLYVSAQWRGAAPLNVPTLWFGLFEIPHLLGLNEAPRESRQAFAGLALGAHVYLAWGTAALLGLHVAAALKHHFVNRDEVFAQMLPALKPADPAAARDGRRRTVIAGGAIAITLAASVLVLAVFKTPLGSAPEAPGGGPESAVVAAAPVAVGAATMGPAATGTPAWAVNQAGSEIVFSGRHAGVAFQGRFTRWRADIRFDPANPAGSVITAEIETGSAADGDPLHEETLPQAEWFDVANHPTAAFRSTGIRPLGADQYDVDGQLTIKGRDLALAPLLLTVAGNHLTISGRLSISRAAANLGMESDPDGEYVSRDIGVAVRVSATRTP